MNDLTIFCPNCKREILKNSIYCQFCGYKINEKISIRRQIYIYAVSLFLPPLGLIWFFRYFRAMETSKRNVGYIALFLTILSTVITFYYTVGLIKNIQSGLTQYSSLGY